MEGNKDEALRCLDIAMAALRQGQAARAEKFARKAESLYPTDRAKQLLASLADADASSSNNSSANHTPAGARRRTFNGGTSPSRAGKQPPSPPPERNYTDAQLEMVRRIKRCKDYYEVLTITKEATDSDIKRAYKKLALQLHPDKNGAPGAVEAFKSVGNAVAVLTDAQKRKAYDLYGIDGTSNGQHAQHHNHHHHGGNEYTTFSRGFESEFTADELFNMFFGTGQANQRMNAQRQQRQYAQQQAGGGGGHQEARPSMAFGLILVLILISMMSSFFTSDPVYSLSASTRYPVRRHTIHLKIQYFVKEKFENDYQGSLARLENSVEEEYTAVMKQNCYRERNYKRIILMDYDKSKCLGFGDMMISRARSYGNNDYFKHASDIKVPSCENLAKIGLTRYMPY